jgi:hypothetical protein
MVEAESCGFLGSPAPHWPRRPPEVVGQRDLGVVVFNLEDGVYTILASAVAVLCLIAVFLIFGLLYMLDARFRLGVLPWST